VGAKGTEFYSSVSVLFYLLTSRPSPSHPQIQILIWSQFFWKGGDTGSLLERQAE